MLLNAKIEKAPAAAESCGGRRAGNGEVNAHCVNDVIGIDVGQLQWGKVAAMLMFLKQFIR